LAGEPEAPLNAETASRKGSDVADIISTGRKREGLKAVSEWRVIRWEKAQLGPPLSQFVDLDA